MARDKEKAKAYRKAYYELHREEMRQKAIERHRRNRAADPEKYDKANRDRANAYYAAHKDECKAKVKAYADARRDDIKEYKKAYNQRNPVATKAKKRAYYLANRVVRMDKQKPHTAKRRALQHGATIGEIDFKKILKDANGLCGICGKPFDLFGIEFDHKVPLSKGGSHTQDNLQATHSYCNRSKGARVG